MNQHTVFSRAILLRIVIYVCFKLSCKKMPKVLIRSFHFANGPVYNSKVRATHTVFWNIY
jgi:hypothetical protein